MYVQCMYVYTYMYICWKLLSMYMYECVLKHMYRGHLYFHHNICSAHAALQLLHVCTNVHACVVNNRYNVHVHVYYASTEIRTITGYGGTLYIGIAMVFVFSPYIWKFSSYFQFQVIRTFNDFTAQHMSKQSCMPNISLKYHF